MQAAVMFAGVVLAMTSRLERQVNKNKMKTFEIMEQLFVKGMSAKSQNVS